ncbi:ankyrin, partial [Peniophora sp. CONT]
GQTALHKAACMGRTTKVCRFLLEHGALIDEPDNDGETSLHCAALCGRLDTVRLLLEYPAADGSNAAALRLHIRDNKGQTALHKAASRGHTEVCRFLLEHGALMDENDDNGETPL